MKIVFIGNVGLGIAITTQAENRCLLDVLSGCLVSLFMTHACRITDLMEGRLRRV